MGGVLVEKLGDAVIFFFTDIVDVDFFLMMILNFDFEKLNKRAIDVERVSVFKIHFLD